ncbi:DUF2911 domain-containing protein [Polluticaenibacter yanchengensis]|uniref:DUF2911 domain-containing protein n=1 Tax=Polluticaenibacter yanchengensis TaxID=3014562 RepID=A0ABT4ULV2_9BACT|nr:DUF2911 domain-containing protein [Chitinophagaceae bacterium LY-5]
MKLLSTIVALLLCLNVMAQGTEPDKSPLDVAYSPNNFPQSKINGKNTSKPNARVLYSRPQLKGRNIFGNEVAFGEIWRLGANEATEIELFKSSLFGGKKLAKGRYSMFCIPNATSWTIIINKDLDGWGAFNYNQANDVIRVAVPTKAEEVPAEYFTMYFDASNNLVIKWDSVSVSIPIKFNAI